MAFGRFVEKIDRKDWRNAVIAGVLIGILPVIGIGLAVNRQILNDPQAALLFGLISLLTGAMFGVTAAAITLVFSVIVRQWPRARRHLIGQYEGFAREVSGQLVQAHPPHKFRFLGSWPQQVRFSYQGCEVFLEIVSEPSGDDEIVYTNLTFDLPKLGSFVCQLYSSGTLSQIGKLFGLDDVPLGDPGFDERFVVKASEVFTACEVLNARFQAGMQELAAWADTVRDRSVFGSRYIEVRIEQGTMQIRLVGFLDSTEKLLTYAAYGERLYDILRAYPNTSP